MPGQASSWSSQQLTEFLAAITRASDEESAVHAAVERAAETLECEIGAFVRAGTVVSSVGFPAGGVPTRELLEVAAAGRSELALSEGSLITLARASLDAPETGELILGRSRSDAFHPEEVILLRGMARVLGMTLTTMRTVESLRERQLLLEKTATIQRAITRRAPLHEVLDLITTAAGELLGDEVIDLRMISPDDPAHTHSISSSGLKPDLLRQIEHGPVGDGTIGRAITEDRLVVIDNYQELPDALPALLAHGLQSAMAAPIHDDGAAVGSLMVASFTRRAYTRAQQEMLVAFAQHASIALLDARTVDELLRQGLHDPLTSLANRALFLDCLERALARCERTNSLVAVLFIDVDRFKPVNDSLGHAAGDQVLIEVARRLQFAVERPETAARFGGDEFALMIEDVPNQAAAAAFATRLIALLGEPFLVEDEEVFLTVSIGIALAGRVGDDPLRDADLAMYRAKHGGKDRYAFFEAGMRNSMLTRAGLEVDLKQAIEGEEFVLHYQPIIDLESGEIDGLEALVRWQHPVRGLLAPAAFIPLAEETGAIGALGQWVLREACRFAASWRPARDGRQPYVSVNLAPLQLQRAELVAEIDAILAGTGLAPGLLSLEITETSLLEDHAALRRLQALKELGLSLAIDDFGTGYSSLNYLQALPVDTLKIPKQFIDQLGSGNPALTRAIVELGRTFELAVVAEGIERQAQLEQLRALGCQTGQGFLLARPQEPEALERQLVGRAPALPKLAAARPRPLVVG